VLPSGPTEDDNHDRDHRAPAFGRTRGTDRQDAAAFRILTGDRPTGRLHLGHYFGTLRNRVRLQDLGAEVFVLIADFQVLTDRDTAERLDEYVTGMLLDYLAIGLDPARTMIFAHSAVPALNQLLLPFLSLVSVPELNRKPDGQGRDRAFAAGVVSGLMLTYPVHQAADILFCKAKPGAGGPGPAAPPGDRPADRPPVSTTATAGRCSRCPTRCYRPRRCCSAPTAPR